MKPPLVRVLRDCAAVLRVPNPAARAARGADLNSALAELRSVARGRYAEDIVAILGEPDDAAALAVGRKLLGRRTFSATVGVTGRIIRNAAAADARPVWARVLGRRLPQTGTADWVMPETTAVAAITKGFLATRAVVLRNSLRTGLGLAVAVAVTHLFPLDNDFWVVLGAMSVLRSSALTTGTRVVRAVAGTRSDSCWVPSSSNWSASIRSSCGPCCRWWRSAPHSCRRSHRSSPARRRSR